jgi:hypothetical protein
VALQELIDPRVVITSLWSSRSCSLRVGSPSILAMPTFDEERFGEGHERVAEAGRSEVVLDPALPILRRAGDAERVVVDLRRRQLQGALNLAPLERLRDGRDLGRVDPVSRQQLRRHRGDVEGGDNSGCLPRRHAEPRRAPVQRTQS